MNNGTNKVVNMKISKYYIKRKKYTYFERGFLVVKKTIKKPNQTEIVKVVWICRSGNTSNF